MSWERGLALGAADEVRRIRNEASANMAQAQAIIDRKSAEIAELAAQIRKLKVALVVEQASSAGVVAKLKAYRVVIDSVAPSEQLIQETGRIYSDGTREKFGDRIYDDAFDAVLESRGIKGEFRMKAK